MTEFQDTSKLFQPYCLSSQNPNLLSTLAKLIPPSQLINALIQGCNVRKNNKFYQGLKFYYLDLQNILNSFPQESPQIFALFHLPLDKNHSKVLVQCDNCAQFTEVWKFCPVCQETHYCHQGCEMKLKLIHEKKCRINFSPPRCPLQVQIHIGSNKGEDVQLYFQHYTSLSLLKRGERLLEEMVFAFQKRKQKGQNIQHQALLEKRMIKFQKLLRVDQEKKQPILKSIDQLIQVYEKIPIIAHLIEWLLERGGVPGKKILEVHDNHFKEIFLIFFP